MKVVSFLETTHRYARHDLTHDVHTYAYATRSIIVLHNFMRTRPTWNHLTCQDDHRFLQVESSGAYKTFKKPGKHTIDRQFMIYSMRPFAVCKIVPSNIKSQLLRVTDIYLIFCQVAATTALCLRCTSDYVFVYDTTGL